MEWQKKGLSLGPMKLLIPLVIILVLAGIIYSYGTDIQQDVADDQDTGSRAEAIANQTMNFTSTATEKTETLVVIFFAGMIIATLVAAFAMGRG